MTYFWATWLGLMPGTFVYVYMGSALRNLADVVSGSTHSSKASMLLLILGVVATLLVLVYVMREAQRTLETGGQGVENSGTGTPINSSGEWRVLMYCSEGWVTRSRSAHTTTRGNLTPAEVTFCNE